MVILISPAKTFKAGNASNLSVIFPKITDKIYLYLKSLSEKELKDSLNISDSILKDVTLYLKEYGKNKTSAITTYYGVTFKSLDYDSLSEDEKNYLNSNLLIMSALYGLLKPETAISKYRLDFLFKGDLDLKNTWKEPINHFLENKYQGETIINLASNEFFDLIDRNRFNIIDIEFFKSKDGKLKKGSSQLKKARGLMVRYMAKNKANKIKDLEDFNLDGYHFSQKLSNNEKLVFIKEK